MPGEQVFLGSGDTLSDSFGKIRLSVFENFDAVESQWRDLESQGPATLYQRFDWVKAWASTVGKSAELDPRIVVATQRQKTLFILPLVIRKSGPAKVVEWLADSHSNFQMGLYSEQFLGACKSQDIIQIMSQIAKLLDGTDLMSLRCQPEILFGYANPMATLQGHKSSNPAFALDLGGGFDAALERINGTKRRKKYRWQMKQLGDQNRVRLKIASTQQEVADVLQTAFAQMATRFGNLGIKNVFADAAPQNFFRGLAAQSLGDAKPTLRLYALEIEGKIRATLAGGQNGDHFSACFISLAEDEFAFLSPGQLLIYSVLKDCAARNITSFDFGRGEEPYKRSWTDQEISMIDIVVPFTAMGRSLAALQRSKSEAKRLVRNNETLWSLAKQMRATLRKAS